MSTDYRKRCHNMHAVSRSPFKRKWDASGVLRSADKRMQELIYPRKKFSVPCARDLSTPISQTSKRRRVALLGLKSLSSELADTEEVESTVLRRKYKIRVTEAENPELEEYKRRVLAATNATNTPPDRKNNSNLEMGPVFSTAGSSSERPKWEELWEAAQSKSSAETLDREAAILEAKLKSLQVTRKEAWESSEKRKSELRKGKKRDVTDAFIKLSEEAEEAVDNALSSRDRHKVLVLHEESNIEITGVVLQCLLPGAWLNDEVINLYLALLKERELREPKKFLRCHFFNTFFYNKIFKDKEKYDYKAVRRWTLQKRLGYNLLECDKIFVPVHKDIHWCLAIINIRDQKFEYLDSLKGIDEDVLDVLSKYIVDEAKDKLGKALDVGDWSHEYPEDIPEQKNGCDCGMFMIKYADFHSRGEPLTFTQEDMPYFRRRTVWEILRLKAT